MVKAVIFDWGGVLTSGTHTSHIIRILEDENSVKIAGHRPSLGSFLDLMDYGEIEFDDFLERVNEEFGLDLSEEYMKDVIARAIIPNSRTIQLAEALSRKYIVAILSNNNPVTIGILQEEHKDTLEIFRKAYFSSELEMHKPDPDIFEFVAEDLEVPVSECIFIDDKEEYLKGARKAGMKCIVFMSNEQLEKDLRALGVTVPSQ